MGDGKYVLERPRFQSLIEALKHKGFKVMGPRAQGENLVWGEILQDKDLPAGYSEQQDAGTFRLKTTDSPLLFNFHVGQHSLKNHLYRPVRGLFEARRQDGGFKILPQKTEAPKTAFLGVRACDLAAVKIQDQIFTQGLSQDPDYLARRRSIFIVAVNCAQGGGTCFCASMGTGPKATGGFDLALTEVLKDGRHYFVVESGTSGGQELLKTMALPPAGQEEAGAAGALEEQAREKMGRSLQREGLKELLQRQFEHSHWDQIAGRCLTCANCTLVCPTCFCSTVEDFTDLKGSTASRQRRWDSCFTLEFSYIHGGSARSSSKSRYRQWMMHKLSTWVDQFGMSGCVGCGRCITWCPVGIDITEEARVFREYEKAPAS